MGRKDKRYIPSSGADLPVMAFIFLAFTLFFGAPVLAQEDRSVSGAYQLRTDITPASSIAPESAKSYGIDQGPRDALVNVVVMHTGGNRETVPAAVEVHARSLAGQVLPVKMRAAAEAGRVSYLGTYKFEPGEVVDFDVAAKPEGFDEALHMRVRKRFPPK